MKRITMIKIHNCYLISLTILIITLAGCAKYKPHPLIKPENSPIIQKQNVEASIKPLSENDCKYYFDRKIIETGYQPIQIHVKNDSEEAYYLDISSINIPVENTGTVASKLLYGPYDTWLPWYVGAFTGFIFLPAFILFIPGIFELANVESANRKLVFDFNERMFDESSKIKINPNACMDRVFFIKKQALPEKIRLSLKNVRTEAFLDFDFNIKKCTSC